MEKYPLDTGPRLLVVAQKKDSQLHVIDREIDIVRARRVADRSVSDGRYFQAWVVDALYEAVAPPDS